MLGADTGAEQGVFGGGDIADREDVRIAGPKRGVHEHAAVPGGQPGLLGKRDVGCGADGHQHGVGVDGGAVAEFESRRRAGGGGDLVDRGAQAQVDAVIAVHGGEHLTGLAAERRHQRHVRRLDDGDRYAAFTSTGGYLQSDPAGADDRK